MSQIMAMAKRLQDAEQTVADLRRALEVRGQSHSRNVASSSASDSPMETNAASDPGHVPQRRHTSQVIVRSPSREPTSEEMLSDLSLDSNGRVSMFSSVSRSGLQQ